MKKLLFLVVLLFIVALQSNLFSIPLDSAGNNKLLWEQNFGGSVDDCAFMPDENYIINIIGENLQIRKTIDQSLVKEKKFSFTLRSIDISPDKKFIVLGGDANIIYILDINTLDTLKSIRTNAGIVQLQFSKDGKKLLHARDKLHVYDLESLKEIFSFGDNKIYLAQFSPDGKYIACAYFSGNDKKIYVFDTDSFKLYATFNDDDYTPGSAFIQQIFFSPNSQYLVAENCAGYLLRVWELNTRKNILNENMETLNVSGNNFIFLNDNETLYFSDYPDFSYFYNMKQRRIIKTLNFSPPIYANPVFNSDETLLLGDRLCLTQIDKSVLSVDGQIQQNNALLKPNPTSGVVTISLELPFTYRTIISIQDVSGRIVDTITNENVIKGQFEYTYDASHLVNGLYFVKISQRTYSITLKLIKE